ncbi:holo-ACP synthase [Paenibacillus kandeliae]|uniref:holo-ACP synthase n=1 Tax=Paenibacillus kandeliae TaxID=3231269 RepID=UPI003459C0B2
MIHGIGHDVLEIARVVALLEGKQKQRFLQRILTPAEQTLAEQRGPRLTEFTAGRFAAKEAITKAFGCGIGKIISFTDIEILPNASGKPQVTLSPEAWQRLDLQQDHNTYHIHLSITHQPTLASAFAIVERST